MLGAWGSWLKKKKKTGKKLANFFQPKKRKKKLANSDKKKNWQKTGNVKLARKKNRQNQKN